MRPELHRGDRRAEHLRGLRDAQPVLFDQLERDALVLGQAAQLEDDARGDLLRDRDVVRGSVERREELRHAVVARGGEDLAATATVHVDEQPTRDRERPRHDLAADDEAASCAMHLQHRLLNDVLCARAVMRIAGEERLQPRREPVVDLLEGRVLAPRIPVHRGVEGCARRLGLAVALFRHVGRSTTHTARLAHREGAPRGRHRGGEESEHVVGCAPQGSTPAVTRGFGMRRIGDLPTLGGSRSYQLLQTVLIDETANAAESMRRRHSYPIERPEIARAPLSHASRTVAACILLSGWPRKADVWSSGPRSPTKLYETAADCSPGRAPADRS